MPTHTIAVVPEADAIDEAYSMGYERFEPLPEPDDIEPAEALSQWKEGADWANSVAPRLRALAGYADSGHGTYRVERTVAVVRDGDEGDLPRDAVEMYPEYVHETLVEAFDMGAMDAMVDNDLGADRRELYLTN
jgi:hypothetical protein